MKIRNLDENEPRVSYRVCYSTCLVVSDLFQQTLPGHVHINADTFVGLHGIACGMLMTADNLTDRCHLVAHLDSVTSPWPIRTPPTA